MNRKTPPDKLRKLPALFACGLLASTLMAPCAWAWDFGDSGSSGSIEDLLFPSGNRSKTEITVQTDPALTQISWEAPTEIAFNAAADGTLTGPSASATTIKNKSAFPIHLTKIDAEQVAPFNLVSDVTAGTETNAIQFSLKTGTHNTDAATGGDTSFYSACNMGYGGSSTDSITIETNSGKIARTSIDLTAPRKAAVVTWTVAAGNVVEWGTIS